MEEGDPPLSVTGVLKRSDPVWWWLRENFRLPSLIAIATCVLTGAGWVYVQHLDLDQLKQHDPGPKLEAIAGQLSAVMQSQSAMQQRLEDFGERIDRQERKWERVESVAEAPLPARATRAQYPRRSDPRPSRPAGGSP
ncbi:MAG: hypothetical protein ACREU6_13905 [Steroidobacteraceae bacterium]